MAGGMLVNSYLTQQSDPRVYLHASVPPSVKEMFFSPGAISNHTFVASDNSLITRFPYRSPAE